MVSVTTSLPIYNCVIFSNSIIILYSVSLSAKTFLVELLQGHNELMYVCRGGNSLSVHLFIPRPLSTSVIWMVVPPPHTLSPSALHLRCILKYINAEENRPDTLLNLRSWGSNAYQSLAGGFSIILQCRVLRLWTFFESFSWHPQPHLSYRQPELL